MNESQDITHRVAAMPPGVDDAVGVPETKWFIAILNSRSEKSAAIKLAKLGVENYLPTLMERHVWKNGKKANVEKVMIPAKIFIHCTERQRKELVNLPFIFRFMTNISGAPNAYGNKPLAVVPGIEIERLKFMLGISDAKVTFTERFVKGEKVEVVRGPFKGLVGEIIHDAEGTTSRLYLNIDFLGSASVEIAPNDVEPIK